MQNKIMISKARFFPWQTLALFHLGERADSTYNLGHFHPSQNLLLEPMLERNIHGAICLKNNMYYDKIRQYV
jgi:hypothetical protein